MSTTGEQESTQEGQDRPVNPEIEWIGAAGEGGGIGQESSLDGACTASAAEEMKVVGSREVDIVGPEGNPEAEEERAEGDNAEEDSDIEPVGNEEAEGVEEDQGMAVDSNQFPMAGFRFMFLDLVHAILHRVYYNDNTQVQPFNEDQEMEPPGTPPGHSGEVQIPPGPTRSTVSATAYGCERQRPDLSLSESEVISTFPELEESADLEEEFEYYLMDPAVRAMEAPTKETAEEMPAAEGPAEQVSKGKHHCDILGKDDKILEDEEEKGREEKKKNQEEPDKMDSDPAECGPSKSS